MADRFGTYGVEGMRVDPNESKIESNTLTDRILRSGKNFIKAGMGDIGISPMPLGLVMRGPTGAANAAKIAREAAMSLPKDASEAEAAIAYMRAKYPKIAAMVDGIYPARARHLNQNTPSGFEEVLGMFKPEENTVHVNAEAKGVPFGGQVNTVGHELTHALQMHRPTTAALGFPQEGAKAPWFASQPDPEAAYRGAVSRLRSYPLERKADLLNRRYEGAYESVHGPETHRLADKEAYLNNPYEVQARQGGATAGKTYLEFLKRRDEGVPLP